MIQNSFTRCILQLVIVLVSLTFERSSAQEVFEDIVYEPRIILYEGLNTAQIENIANRAFENIKNYHNKTAQESFDSIVAMDKNNVLGHYGLAYCKFADGDYENAIEKLTPLINVNQKNGGLFSLRARCYMLLQNMDKAIDDFKNSLAYSPSENDQLSLSQCLFYSGNFEASVLEAEKYIRLQIQKPQGYFVKGLAKAGLKEYELAMEALDKACDLDSKNNMVFYHTARVLVEKGDLNKAVKSINKAIKLDVENSDAVQLRAELKYELHDYTNSIFDCNRVIELGDASNMTFLVRGKSNLKIGLKKEACADFTKAQQLGNAQATDLLLKSCK